MKRASVIPVDDAIASDIDAFRRARAARQKIAKDLAGPACPPASIEAAWRAARDAEADAALDLACAIESRAR